jgi:hypothetical protein
MKANAATLTMLMTSVEKRVVNVPTAAVGPANATAPPMNASKTATFAPVTSNWKVPDSSVPRALSTPSSIAVSTPKVPWGRK